MVVLMLCWQLITRWKSLHSYFWISSPNNALWLWSQEKHAQSHSKIPVDCQSELKIPFPFSFCSAAAPLSSCTRNPLHVLNLQYFKGQSLSEYVIAFFKNICMEISSVFPPQWPLFHHILKSQLLELTALFPFSLSPSSLLSALCHFYSLPILPPSPPPPPSSACSHPSALAPPPRPPFDSFGMKRKCLPVGSQVAHPEGWLRLMPAIQLCWFTPRRPQGSVGDYTVLCWRGRGRQTKQAERVRELRTEMERERQMSWGRWSPAGPLLARRLLLPDHAFLYVIVLQSCTAYFSRTVHVSEYILT